MRKILDKFDQSSPVLKVLIVLLAVLILLTGLVFARHNNRSEAGPSRVTRTSSTQPSSTEKSEEETEREMDEAIKALEANPSREQLDAIRPTLESVKNEANRAAFEARLQAVEEGLNSESSSTTSSASTQAPVATQTPAATPSPAPATQEQTPAPTPEAPATNSVQLYEDANGRTYTADQVYTDPETGEIFVR